MTKRPLGTIFLLSCMLSVVYSAIETSEDCKDFDFNCNDWVAQDAAICDRTPYIKQSCRRSCGYCKYLPKKFDISRVPYNLQHLAFLVGIWRSEHGGKAFFPTIPKFTYGEQLEFALSDKHTGSMPALNYTAFAWSMVDMEELHAENGYITVQPDSRLVSMNTVMSNGFATIEEGQVNHNRIQFRLVDIGRLSFSRDLPVHDETFYMFSLVVLVFAFGLAIFLAKIVGIRLKEHDIQINRQWRDWRPANPFKFPWNVAKELQQKVRSAARTVKQE